MKIKRTELSTLMTEMLAKVAWIEMARANISVPMTVALAEAAKL